MSNDDVVERNVVADTTNSNSWSLCRFDEGDGIVISRYCARGSTDGNHHHRHHHDVDVDIRLSRFELEQTIHSHLRTTTTPTTTDMTNIMPLANGSSNTTKEHQKKPQDDANPSSVQWQSIVNEEPINGNSTRAATLTTTMSHPLVVPPPPLQIMTRYDAHWLDCRRPFRMVSSIFGIDEEDEHEQEEEKESERLQDTKVVQVQVYQGLVVGNDNIQSNNNNIITNLPTTNGACAAAANAPSVYPRLGSTTTTSCGCACRPPHRDWRLQQHDRTCCLKEMDPTVSLSSSTTFSSSSSSAAAAAAIPTPAPTSDPTMLIRWVDLRAWQRNYQQQQNQPSSATSTTTSIPFLNSPAAVTHFLRSLLGTLHDASIWVDDDRQSSSSPNVVALLLMNPVPPHLLNYRVGDASPSFYLHSVAQLQHIPQNDVTWWHHHGEKNQKQTTTQHQQNGTRILLDDHVTLLVYRKLSPRDHLSILHPKQPHIYPTPKGCLWETYYYREETDEDEADVEGAGEGNDDGAEIVTKTNNGDRNDLDDQEQQQDEQQDEEALYRVVAPPYISCDECYPGLLDPLLTPESMSILRKDALNIAHWTAWPEKQHYRSVSTTTTTTTSPNTSIENDDDDDEYDDTNPNNSNNNGPASWTVFPLCYCFPANDASALTWIDQTCAMVPETVQLLQKHIGPNYLRTTLFSRLDAESTLEPHVGWADLSNHVIRVHIPLIVPYGGCCGTWVDGCVESHEEGRLLCLDDAKLHRAFNYSKEPRIVLIVDLVRPLHLIPLGTATGGHSDELDQFIEHMSSPGGGN